jgi:RNA polymerase sigma factor (sigma-70 family)
LNPDQKKVVDLLYFQGYTQSEVAKEHGIPLGTIKTRLRIALKQLRKIVHHIEH